MFCQKIENLAKNQTFSSKNENDPQKFKLSSNIEILAKNRNLGQKSEFWSKIKLLVKIFIFVQDWFWSTIRILKFDFKIWVKNWNFGEKSKFFSKLEFFVKNQNFGQKLKHWSKNLILGKNHNFVSKIETWWKFASKTEILNANLRRVYICDLFPKSFNFNSKIRVFSFDSFFIFGDRLNFIILRLAKLLERLATLIQLRGQFLICNFYISFVLFFRSKIFFTAKHGFFRQAKLCSFCSPEKHAEKSLLEKHFIGISCYYYWSVIKILKNLNCDGKMAFLGAIFSANF